MLQEQALAPLRRPAARKTADDLHDDLARLEASVVDGMILNADKLTRMLQTTEAVSEATGTCRADDLHDLVKLHEARNVAICCRRRLPLRARSHRKPRAVLPRGLPDDRPVLVLLARRHAERATAASSSTGGTFRPRAYRFKPQAPEEIALGPIGAIIRGEHAALAHS